MIAFDLPLGLDSPDPGAVAAIAEDRGIDGVWSTEAGHDPYLPLGVVANATERVQFGTAIAVAFPRSPMVHAQVAWDLHRAAPGRFVLGLGAQVKAHNERRYGVAGDHPIGRMRDMVRAIRAIWECWQEGTPLRYEGEFYKHTLMTPFFNPGPVHHPSPPPIYLAAVSEAMLKVAGEVADGVHVHPLHTEKSLDDLTFRAAREAASDAGRDASALTFVVPIMMAVGATDAELEMQRMAMRSQIAFYGSTPAYRPVLEIEGRGDLADELHTLSKRGAWDEMPACVDDEFFEKVCLTAKWDGIADAILTRYRGRADRVMPYVLPDADAPWAEVARAVREGSA